MSGKKKESPVERILRTAELAGRPRDAAVINQLTHAVIHPSQIADSPYLSDDDPLRISARHIVEDFEAVTNGMDRPENPAECRDGESEGPLEPWRILINTIEAFYSGDKAEMMELVRSIPENTAPSALVGVFESLNGRPADSAGDGLSENLMKRRIGLSEGLEVLDEASTYPDLLRKELAQYLPLLARENVEEARRLYYWAMNVLAEEGPLTETDELHAIVPGVGEASRICSLASMKYDPDRAFTSWIRSLQAVIRSREIGPEEAVERLKIAGEIAETARQCNMLSDDVLFIGSNLLSGMYRELRKLLPEIESLPAEPKDLVAWLKGNERESKTASRIRNLNALRKTGHLRYSESATQKMFQFDEVPG